ncbi:MAG: hypothetical protein ACLS90_06235 [Clostridia bacterium]
MKKVGFIGMYDKTDMILNIAKILTTMQKKVIIVDSTITQKAKYVVPVINPTIKYVTTFEDIDVAVGFNNENDIKEYVGIEKNEELPYDIMLLDIDNIEAIGNFKAVENAKNYFVTAFDLYTLKRGLEILSELNVPMHLTKILFSKDILKEDDDYLNFLALGYKVMWNEYRIYFPIENGDWSVLAENQRVAKIKFKRLSAQYKDSLVYIVGEILNDISENQIRKAVKIIERGV